MKTLKIINSSISIGSYQDFISNIFELRDKKDSSYVCVANVHMTIEAYKDETFEKIVNDADLTTPDGMPLAKGIKYLYGIQQDRVAGMDITPDIMKRCELEGKSIFVYGLTEATLKLFEKKAREDFPRLKMETLSPPFRDLSSDEKDEVIGTIHSFDPDFVFVALGCPKQEKWMVEHKDIINSCMIGLGGALEVYAGAKERAPQWMQENSLEWLYRLVQDPRRLWKRYFVTNTMFLLLFSWQFIKQKILKISSDKEEAHHDT